MRAADLYEVFVLWSAYNELHERVGGNARTSDPRDLVGKVAAYGHERAAAAICAEGIAIDFQEGQLVLAELLALAANGRRPRYGNEITPDFHTQLTQALQPDNPEGAAPWS